MQLKIIANWDDNKELLPIEKEEGILLAKKLAIATLERSWRILQSAIIDTNNFNNTKQSAEMAIIRLCYALSLPNMEELAKITPLLLNKAKELEEKISEPQEIIKNILSLNPNAHITISEKIRS